MSSITNFDWKTLTDIDWKTLLKNINNKIEDEYSTYSLWLDGTARDRNYNPPEPFTFYSLSTIIPDLYLKSLLLACVFGNYKDLSDQLMCLRSITPEYESDYHFSSLIIDSLEIPLVYKKKILTTFIIGHISGLFSPNIIVDVDKYTDFTDLYIEFSKKADEFKYNALLIILESEEITKKYNHAEICYPEREIWQLRMNYILSLISEENDIDTIAKAIETYNSE